MAQIRTGRLASTLSKENRLITTGVLGWIRHPWYAGAFCLLAARPLNAASLTSNIVLFSYLIIGARLEERRLVGEFGDAYRRYRAQVPMFVPWTLGRAVLGKRSGNRNKESPLSPTDTRGRL